MDIDLHQVHLVHIIYKNSRILFLVFLASPWQNLQGGESMHHPGDHNDYLLRYKNKCTGFRCFNREISIRTRSTQVNPILHYDATIQGQ